MNVRRVKYFDADRREWRYRFGVLWCGSELAKRFWERESLKMRIQFDPARLPA